VPRINVASLLSWLSARSDEGTRFILGTAKQLHHPRTSTCRDLREVCPSRKSHRYNYNGCLFSHLRSASHLGCMTRSEKNFLIKTACHFEDHQAQNQISSCITKQRLAFQFTMAVEDQTRLESLRTMTDLGVEMLPGTEIMTDMAGAQFVHAHGSSSSAVLIPKVGFVNTTRAGSLLTAAAFKQPKRSSCKLQP